MTMSKNNTRDDPEIDENSEEYRDVEAQLDHLNQYMDSMEERIRQHNEKLRALLNEQRAEREQKKSEN
uniref:Uncharacterized protein n=1 Tax=Plectus sambesii TaxID=2011161 RepID=A0A914XAQ3_9BILA